MYRKLLLPINTAGSANAPAASANVGFVQFSEGHNLGTISNEINNSPFVGGDIGDHAIPSILAHLQYTREIVEQNNLSNEAFLPWQGVLAIIGLSKLYGFSLSVRTVDLSQQGTLLSGILNKSLMQEGICVDGKLTLICKNNSPIAVVYPDVLFCPFKTVHNEALQDVPWFQDGQWLDVSPCLKRAEREFLSGWISTFLANARPMVAQTLKDFCARLSRHRINMINSVQGGGAQEPLHRAWRGVLAMVGLSQMYGFSLEFEKTDLSIDNGMARDIIEKCLPGKELVFSPVHLIMLKKDHLPIAVTDPDLLLCPLQDIEPAALSGAPWYQGQSGEWLSVSETLGEAERISLASWLNEARITDQKLKPVCDQFINDLCEGRPLMAPGKTRLLCDPKLFALARIPASNIEDFLKIPGFPVDMPPIFNDRLALTLADLQTVLGTGEQLGFMMEKNGRSVVLHAISPLTQELTQGFLQHTEDPVLELVNIKLDSSRFASNYSLTVTVTLKNGNFYPVRSHTYSADKIDYIPNLPYLTLWPYVNLPAEHWKSYYISLLENDSDAGSGVLPQLHEVDGARLSIDCSPQNKESGYENYSWKVSVLQKMPRYLHFYYQENNETRNLGCLFIDPPEDQNLKCSNFGKSAVVGIDFGTTNTIYSIMISGGNLSHEIVKGCYLKDLTPPRDPAQKEIFTSQYWMPQVDKSGKFLSIAQLYANRNGSSDMRPYEEGGMMFVDQKVLNHFMAKSGAGGEVRTLSEIGIYNDMKFGQPEDGEENAEESFAARIFMKNVLLDAALAAKLRGANSIRLNISYPQEEVKENLQNHWEEARGFIEELDINLSFHDGIHYLTEAESAARFFDKKLADGLAADPEAGFAILDIGGGTADISIWKADPITSADGGKAHPARLRGSLSLLYAGREIVVKTIFRQFSQGATEEFKNLWNHADTPETNQLFELYDSLVKNVDPNHNLETDPTYKNIRVILDTLIDKASFRYDHIFRPGTVQKYSHMTAVMRLKFLNVFYVLANYIKELGAIDQNAGTFKIFLAGGSSQALRFCARGKDLRGFSNTDFGEYLRMVVGEVVGASSKEIQIVEPQTNDKSEVAIGLTIPAESLKRTVAEDRFKVIEEPTPKPELARETMSDTAQLRADWRACYEHYISNYIHREGGMFSYTNSSSRNADLFESLDLKQSNNEERYSQSKIFSKVLGNREYPIEVKPYIFAVLMADRLL